MPASAASSSSRPASHASSWRIALSYARRVFALMAARWLRRPEARRVIGAGSAIVTTGDGIGLRSGDFEPSRRPTRGRACCVGPERRPSSTCALDDLHLRRRGCEVGAGWVTLQIGFHRAWARPRSARICVRMDGGMGGLQVKSRTRPRPCAKFPAASKFFYTLRLALWLGWREKGAERAQSRRSAFVCTFRPAGGCLCLRLTYTTPVTFGSANVYWRNSMDDPAVSG